MKAARTRVWVTGFDTYAKMFESDAASESETLFSQAIESEAWGHIQRLLLSAEQLGFDPRDPDILRRAIVAGKAAHAAEPKPRLSVVGSVQAHEPLVYYMQLGQLIKIGTTTNILLRVSSLNPERVMAVEAGDRTKEAKRHREFALARRHGEWFDPTPELLDHISRTREQFESASGLTLDEWLARPSLRKKPPTSSASTPDSSPSGHATEMSRRSAASE
jgi:hypothetical protein